MGKARRSQGCIERVVLVKLLPVPGEQSLHQGSHILRKEPQHKRLERVSQLPRGIKPRKRPAPRDGIIARQIAPQQNAVTEIAVAVFSVICGGGQQLQGHVRRVAGAQFCHSCAVIIHQHCHARHRGVHASHRNARIIVVNLRVVGYPHGNRAGFPGERLRGRYRQRRIAPGPDKAQRGAAKQRRQRKAKPAREQKRGASCCRSEQRKIEQKLRRQQIMGQQQRRGIAGKNPNELTHGPFRLRAGRPAASQPPPRAGRPPPHW